MSAFGGAAPGYFGTFDVAFFTLLLVTAGDPWPEAMPRLNEDGSANWPAMAYCACYIIVSTWLILQVPRRPGGPGPGALIGLSCRGRASKARPGRVGRCFSRALAGAFALRGPGAPRRVPCCGRGRALSGRSLQSQRQLLSRSGGGFVPTRTRARRAPAAEGAGDAEQAGKRARGQAMAWSARIGRRLLLCRWCANCLCSNY